MAGAGRFPADDGDIAKATFVAGMGRLRARWRADAVGTQQPGAGFGGSLAGGRADAQVIEPHLPRLIAAAGGEQAGLER